MTASEVSMPMFPLGTPLVPAMPLPLHVFEPRYRALMDVVMATEDREFGVVMIERGSEVGGGDRRTRIGTVARILQAERTDDGRWAVIAIGMRRIDVAEWLPDDPYPVASVIDRPDGPWTPDAASALRAAESRVRRVLAMLAELGDPAPPATADLAIDAVTRHWQLIGLSPLGPLDRHDLLRQDDPAERLSALARLMDDQQAMLALRMQGL